MEQESSKKCRITCLKKMNCHGTIFIAYCKAHTLLPTQLCGRYNHIQRAAK
jgi:hypothetical protein